MGTCMRKPLRLFWQSVPKASLGAVQVRYRRQYWRNL